MQLILLHDPSKSVMISSMSTLNHTEYINEVTLLGYEFSEYICFYYYMNFGFGYLLVTSNFLYSRKIFEENAKPQKPQDKVTLVVEI